MLKNICLFVDDKFSPRNVYGFDLDDTENENRFHWVKSFDEAVEWIIENGCPISVDLDYDLSEFKTGNDIALWMINKDIESKGTFFPKDFGYSSHSGSPDNRMLIYKTFRDYFDLRPIS